MHSIALHQNKALLFLVFLLAVSFFGCGSSRQVSRLSEDAATDLSGDWNDTDARLVADEMIKDVMTQPWNDDFQKKEERKPVLVVGKISNRTSEHIDVKVFVKSLERAMLNSGEVDFVAATDERSQIRDERKDQAKQASEETQKGPGQEIGADLMLVGNISSVIDQAGGDRVKFYQVNMELVRIADNRKVWIGEKKLKKLVSQDRYKP